MKPAETSFKKNFLGTDVGTGLIPADSISKITYRQAGVSNVVDTVKVRCPHGLSTISFRTFDQGWRKFQGAAPEFIWLDEEPEDIRIYPECLTRVLTSKGIIFVTFTPLLGETDLVRHFEKGIAGTSVQTATWDDAPHLSDEIKERFIESFPLHERDARTKGVPMMGEGRVFPVDEKELSIPSFEIPTHFARICGVDFGISHPAAASWIAWDRDSDIVYVYDCYKQANETPVYHAQAISKRGNWIPVSFPHDGMNREKSGRKTLRDHYAESGVNMLGISARYDNKKGGAQPVEPIVMEMLERMKTGRFKVFSHLNEWFSEFRNLHRKEGKIQAVRDDILKSTMYGVMMKRYSITERLPPASHRYKAPIMSMRL